jgi:non-specific serine/threonine protein kinase
MTDAHGERVADVAVAFGDILRRYREQAGLSQEELAEKAGVSAAGISALERGVRQQPYPATLRQLADALGLADRERADFLAKPHSPRTTSQTTPPPGVLRFPARGGPHAVPVLPGAKPNPTNLPAELNRFIGRRQPLADVSRLLTDTPSGPRLLTLTGAGGCGKTRLALRAATNLTANYRDGVWLVELASLADPDLVTASVTTTLGIRGSPEQPLLESLLAFLRPRQLLLILDNCERLVVTVASLAAALLGDCPGIRILATSREPLRIDGETTFRVPSLAVPALPERYSLDALADVESIGLFLDRAAAAQPGFALSDQNAWFVAEICRRLDGIPLAIELAAMRVRALSVEQIARRLDQRFALLTSGNRAALPRQQTLAATVAWSYDLLSDAEQRLFEALSVFAGSFSLEAVEAVGTNLTPRPSPGAPGEGVRTDPTPARPPPRGEGLGGEALPLLADLVDKSLVAAEPGPDGTTRYHLLETLRQYAAEKLRLRDDASAFQQRHATYYAQLTLDLFDDMLDSQDLARYFDRLSREIANVRAMLGWHLEHNQIAAGYRAFAATVNYWGLYASRVEGMTWFQRYLEAPEQHELPWELRVGMLSFAGNYGLDLGELTTSRNQLLQAIELARPHGCTSTLALALNLLGFVLFARGELGEAEAALHEGLSVARKSEFSQEIQRALILLGDLARFRGNLQQAQAYYDEVLQLERPAFGNWTWRNVAWTALRVGDLARAARCVRTSLAGYREWHHIEGSIACLAMYAALAAARGNLGHTAELSGVVENGLQALGGRLQFGDHFEHERTLEELRAGLSPDELAAALARGRAMSLDDAVAKTLNDLTEASDDR